MTIEKVTDKVHHLWEKNFKGFALKTHDGLCPSTLWAFKKAQAKLLSFLKKYLII